MPEYQGPIALRIRSLTLWHFPKAGNLRDLFPVVSLNVFAVDGAVWEPVTAWPGRA